MLTLHLIKLLGSVWVREEIPNNWSESVILPIYKNCDTSSFANHRKTSLVGTISKLVSFFPDYLVLAKGVYMRIKLVFIPIGVVLTRFSLCNRS